MQLTDNPYFKILIKEAKEISSVSLNDLMNQKNRVDDFCFSLDPLWVDMTRQFITPTIFDNLIKLAEASGIEEKFSKLANGEPINKTENRPVLHTKLRQKERYKSAEWQKLTSFCEQVRSNKNIRTIVNIGIGGSDLGPSMVTSALKPFQGNQNIRFVSNVDPADLNDNLLDCDPKRTFFS